MRRPALAALAALALSACAGDDFARPGTWQPAGANEANLRAMLADPAHAARGVAAETERGATAGRAIRALDRGRRPPLPETQLSRVGGSGAAAGTPPAAGGADAR
jgi:hypothetical protein